MRATLKRGILCGLFTFGFGVPVEAADAVPLPPKLKIEGPAQTRVVAYIHGNVPVTRDELADFLITRGGAEKLDLLVNKRIVEAEAARRNITVTAKEIEVALNEDLKGVQRKEVVNMILQRYGKTLLEWREDVVRPRLLLGKMVREGVKVSEAEIRTAHETQYGEKRQARVIIWPKPVPNAPAGTPSGPPAPEVVAAVRGSEAEFDKIASNQSDARLAESRGRIAPVGRHLEAEDPKAVNVLFTLNKDQISDLFETKTSWMIVQCIAIVPPDADHSLDKPAVRNEIEREVLDKKLGAEIPKLFDELKKQYKPDYVLRPKGDVQQASLNAAVPPLPPGGPEQVLATITGPAGTLSISREDLGEFLILRGGADKLELLVNRRIVQMEAEKRGVQFTQQEIDAAFDELVKSAGSNITKEVFVKEILPRNKKTLYEYIEDVVKPDVVLRKMVRDRVKIGSDELTKAFERKYGEKRQCEIITWRKGEEKVALKEWTAIRNGATSFDRVARTQGDPNLAAAGGRVAPIGRHVEAEDPVIERVVFDLRVGEISHLLQTRTGTMCIRCSGIVPPVKEAKLDDVREQLEREEFEKLVTREIPKFFVEIKKQAAPTMLLQTSFTPAEFERAVRQEADEVLNGKAASVPKK